MGNLSPYGEPTPFWATNAIMGNLCPCGPPMPLRVTCVAYTKDILEQNDPVKTRLHRSNISLR